MGSGVCQNYREYHSLVKDWFTTMIKRKTFVALEKCKPSQIAYLVKNCQLFFVILMICFLAFFLNAVKILKLTNDKKFFFTNICD